MITIENLCNGLIRCLYLKSKLLWLPSTVLISNIHYLPNMVGIMSAHICDFVSPIVDLFFSSLLNLGFPFGLYTLPLIRESVRTVKREANTWILEGNLVMIFSVRQRAPWYAFSK